VTISLVLFYLLAHSLIPLGPVCRARGATQSLVEADWIKQAKAWKDPPKPVDQSSTSPWPTPKGRVEKERDTSYPTGHFLVCGRRLAKDLKQMGIHVQPHEARLKEFQKQFNKLDIQASDDTRRMLYIAVRRTVRQLVFLNPLIDFEELLFVKRFTQETYPDVCLNHMPWVSRPGGDICVLSMAGPTEEPEVRRILNGALGPGHVHGIELVE